MKPSINTAPKPPPTLSKNAKAWWKSVVSDFDLDPHHVHLLRLACEALDQAAEARKHLDEDGSVFDDRFGQPKESPCGRKSSTDARNDFRVLMP